MSVGGPQRAIGTATTVWCDWPRCLLPAVFDSDTLKVTRCYKHLPWFTDLCAEGVHCICYEDGRACCTCEARKP